MMSRLYYGQISKPRLASGSGGEVDLAEAAKKISKIIPTEIVAGYASLIGVAITIKSESWRLPACVACFLICWVLVPLYLNKVADPGKPKRNHLIVSTLAFPFWAYLATGNQIVPNWFDPALGMIAALAFSLISAVVPTNK